jgi:hypothetical protein
LVRVKRSIVGRLINADLVNFYHPKRLALKIGLGTEEYANLAINDQFV